MELRELRGLSSDDKTGQVIDHWATLVTHFLRCRKRLWRVCQQQTSGRQMDKQQKSLNFKNRPAVFDVVFEDLQGLREGLESIGPLIAAGVSQLVESPTLSTLLRPAEPNESVVNEGATSVTQTADDGDSRQITVINRIPKTVVAVLKQQFCLMNRMAGIDAPRQSDSTGRHLGIAPTDGRVSAALRKTHTANRYRGELVGKSL